VARDHIGIGALPRRGITRHARRSRLRIPARRLRHPPASKRLLRVGGGHVPVMMTGVPVMVASECGRRNDGEDHGDADCFHSK
jgi:hypothetical protein